MNIDRYWDAYDATLQRIRTEKPGTFKALKAILDDFHPPSAGDAFFPDGADDTLASALDDAGWDIRFTEGSYVYTARHSVTAVTAAKLQYVEGDVFDKTPKPAPICPRCGKPLVPGCCDTTTDHTDHATEENER